MLGSGVAIAVTDTLSKRQLPELLFKAVPWVLTSATPVVGINQFDAKSGVIERTRIANGRSQTSKPVLPC